MTHPPIYILRHGETQWNRAGRLQGHLNSELTTKGRAQAQAQGVLLEQVFRDHPEAQVLCSPLGRAQQTARIALAQHNRAAITDPDLSEITAGSWDGQLVSEIERQNADLYAQSRNAFELMFLAPDGEGAAAVEDRVKRLLAGLTGPSVLVTHGATLCVIRGTLRGLSFDETMDLEHEQGCIYALENGHETIVRLP